MKTSIHFGLVYIPVVLTPSARIDEISFNQLDKKTLSRVRYIKTCEDCDGNKIEQGDIVKGYQYQKDKYVIFEDDDFEKIKGDTDKSIEVESFANLNEIDPTYYDKHYHVSHDGNEKGFALLLKLLESENKVAVAKSLIGSKEKLIVLRAKNGKMLLSTLFFEHEITASNSKDTTVKPSDKELKLGKQLLESMIEPFEPKKYKDEYKEKLKDAIQLKIEGKEIKESKKKAGLSAADLMEALTKSINYGLHTKKPKPKITKTATPVAKSTRAADNSKPKTTTKSPSKPSSTAKPKTNATARSKKAVQQRGVAVRAKAGRA